MRTQTISDEVSRKFSFYMLGFIFIVVLFHSDFRFFYPFIEDLTAVSTSYFFCVSAFFFYRGLSEENMKARLKKRCVTLLLPYLLWNLVYMLLYIGKYSFSVSNIIRNFTVDPLCTPSWYLLTLFIFLLPAWLIKRAFTNSYSTVILLGAAIVISYLGYIRFQLPVAQIPILGGYLVRMAEYLVPYLLGGIIGTRFSEKINVGWKNCIVGVISSCVIIVLLKNNIPVEMRWILWMILPLILWEAVPEKIFSCLGFLHWFTEPAFLINMTHCYFLLIWQIILSNMGLSEGKTFAFFYVISALASSYILYYLLKLLVPKLLNILTGSRVKKPQKTQTLKEKEVA